MLTKKEVTELYDLLSGLEIHDSYPYRCAECGQVYPDHMPRCLLKKLLDRLEEEMKKGLRGK